MPCGYSLDDLPEGVRGVLARRMAELEPEARRLREAMLRGESPESLGLIEIPPRPEWDRCQPAEGGG